MSLNKVMLIGNVGAEPTVRYMETGVCVASVRLATTERGYTTSTGAQIPERTEWHNLVFWRQNAEVVEKYVHKGDKLYVEGKIQSRNYTDKQGITRQVVEIMVSGMEMLTPPKQNAAPTSQPYQAAPAQSQTIAEPMASEEDVPF